MNSKFLNYYSKEITFLKEMGQEFALQYPKIASRLSLNTSDIPDPYIERLLEGVSFLSARTQLKIDSEYPKFVQRILEVVYPDFLSPQPSTGIIYLEPDTQYNTDAIQVLHRGHVLNSQPIDKLKITCPFSITRTTPILPLKIEDAHYSNNLGNLPNRLSSIKLNQIKSALKLNISITTAGKCSDIIPEGLNIFLGDDLPKSSSLLYLMISCCKGVICHAHDNPKKWFYEIEMLPEQLGFGEDEALTFNLEKTINSYRILQEYAFFPEKFNFIVQKGIKDAILDAEKKGHLPIFAQQEETTSQANGINRKIITNNKRFISLTFFFDKENIDLMKSINQKDFSLNAVPIVNLFRKRGSRFPINMNENEFHVVIDRTHPLNYEVHSIEQVRGFDANNCQENIFAPMYQAPDLGTFPIEKDNSYFSMQRLNRVPSLEIRKNGYRSSYLGSEVFLALTISKNKLLQTHIKQLSVDAWCTSRDLPILIPRNASSDFLIDSALPIHKIKLISRLTRPKEAVSDDESLWSILNILSLNYLTILNDDKSNSVIRLKELLRVFSKDENDFLNNQIESIISVKTLITNKIIRSKGYASPIRGVEILIILDEMFLGGVHPFLLGSILNHYFCQIVSINSFIQLTIESPQSGHIATWPATSGGKSIL